MKSDDVDAVTVHDAGGRRRFIRRGSALLLAGGAAAALPGTALADCDRRGYSGQKQAGNGSDSDSGAEGDRPGCGRRETPKISDASPRQVPGRRVRVGRVVG